MIFVGSPDKGYFAEEIANKEEIPFAYVEANGHIDAQINDILEHGKQDYVIFDIEQYIDDAEQIASKIQQICRANTSQPIILASGYMEASTIIVTLANYEIKYFIMASMLSDMKDQLQKCMNGFYDANGITIVEELKQQQEEEKAVEQMLKSNSKTIAVAGACSRIGTTTICMQLIKYIQLQGKSACYIQFFDSNYVDAMKEWYSCDQDEEKGLLTFQGVDHFYNLDKIKDIMNSGYDYYIYDYGNFFGRDFRKISFLERDIQIFVVGSEPEELNGTLKIVESSFYDSVNYIFNLAAEADHASLLEMMDDKAAKTYFAGYIPDKYVYKPNDCYAAIIPIDGAQPSHKQQSMKKGLFERFKKNGK